jgi:hypothetical protein
MVYSNNPVAIRRVIEAFSGKRPAMARAKDFVYIRTLYPLADPKEDGFVFLSDAFLRHLTGPRLRIAEKRRLEAVTTLELCKNAALFYLWEHPGAKVPTLDQLLAQKVLDRQHLTLEPGDKLSWDPAGFAASSARYGRMGALTPNLELPVDKVTVQEKQEYERFRGWYQDYWRQFFDPIGIRITARDTVALAVTILPLIEHSDYNRFKENLGGASVELEPVARGDKTVLHFAVHLNPQSADYQQMQTFTVNMLPGHNQAAIQWLGERAEFWIEDSTAFLDALKNEKIADVFRIPMVGAVEVKSPMGLTAFLVAFKTLVDTSAPNMVVFEQTERYRDFTFTRIRAGAQALAGGDDFKDLSIFYGSVGTMLYVSTSFDALKRVVDGVLAAKDSKGKAPTAQDRYGAAKDGHLAFRLDLKDHKSALEFLRLTLGRKALKAEREHLRTLWLLAHTVGLGTGALVPPEAVLGYGIESALGNTYSYDPKKDEVVGSQSGSLWSLKPPDPLPAGSPLGKLLSTVQHVRGTLEFTKEGLHTELSIKRTP